MYMCILLNLNAVNLMCTEYKVKMLEFCDTVLEFSVLVSLNNNLYHVDDFFLNS